MPKDVQQPADTQEQTAALEDASSESASATATEEEQQRQQQDEQQKHRGGFQRRIDKLVKQNSDTEREKEYWRQQALRTPATGQQQEQQTEKPAVKQEAKPADGKPDPSNYQTQAEYLDALTDWKIDQRDKKGTETRQQTEEQKQAQERHKQFQGREDGFREAMPDYDEVIQEGIAEDLPMSPSLFSEIQEHEHGPALLYYLVKNPKEMTRLALMTPTQVAREVVRLESNFVSAQGQQEEEQRDTAAVATRAPKPVTPVGRGNTRTAEKDPGEMSPEEYRAWRKKAYPKL